MSREQENLLCHDKVNKQGNLSAYFFNLKMHIIFLTSTHSQHLKHRTDVPDCLTSVSSSQFQLRPKKYNIQLHQVSSCGKRNHLGKTAKCKGWGTSQKSLGTATGLGSSNSPWSGKPRNAQAVLDSFNTMSLPGVLVLAG